VLAQEKALPMKTSKAIDLNVSAPGHGALILVKWMEFIDPAPVEINRVTDIMRFWFDPFRFHALRPYRHKRIILKLALTGFSVGWVVNAIGCGNIFDQKWINALETSNVHAILMRMRATLVMGVNATNATEIVLRLFAIELIKG